ncbi:glycosyltransferase involved in cell wall biosynthesis [Microbacteriaceae bacterium SG_E_30_P1]|uniref:Glycosyltransferase involved in cell wall biosynthesis n=1 Tax=Antiquaquibacter oligotrophicus TaxID=2880260 RepID=A0ABT6KSI7_9MICO|nr:glycosyltransferase [Antiquaquibacter oligotrophicus]MDH6182037.1 glycosyltransferase involved in cell wall biosynthesis [Antiquaquibacter oligotrophicus]UDF12295.1 glycosyltransferase [Antiquaquibacter oligotrophicus]
MSDEETPQSFDPNPRIVDEYTALVEGRYADGSLGRLLIVVSTADLGMSRGDLYVAMGLAKYLRRRGWGITLWPTERWTEQTPEGYHAAIVMIETFVPGLIHPDTHVIAWVRNWTERWAALPYLDTFSQVWCSSPASADRIREVYRGRVEVVPLATDHELFSPQPVERADAVVTTANFWGVNRGLGDALARIAEHETVTWYGKNARFLDLPEGIDHRHTMDYFALPWVYSAWRFVVDDVIEAASVYGTLNSRLFDALACGAIVVTNTRSGLAELGLDEVPVYENADDLVGLIARLREDADAGVALSERLRAIVLERHTYELRAEAVSAYLEECVPGADRTALLAWSTELREAFRSEEFEHARLRTAYHDLYDEVLHRRKHIEQLEAAVHAYQNSRVRRYWGYVRRVFGR